MKKLLVIALCSLFVCKKNATAQDRKCGVQQLKEALIAKDPAFVQTLQQIKEIQRQQAEDFAQQSGVEKYAKTTSIGTIPVIFHIVLDSAQINQIGGSSGIAERADSQIAAINRDFNKGNTDSSLIPAGFKPLYANVGIHFGLAHRTPSGASTPGYEIIATSQPGFSDPNSSYSTAKHTGSYGANIWDPTSYLNVWVINPLGASGLIGLTVPKSYIGSMPQNEEGIIIAYGAFGIQRIPSQYFIANITKGRTLTHELGHFFEIWHPWGDDNGLCPWNGGQDDGIADTPPEADASYGCPSYPKYDACDTNGNGVMFMNYMDYTDDACMHMFTTGQVAQMVPNVMPGGESYSLTTHPDLLTYPTSVTELEKENSLNISPNPSTGIFNISFNDIPQNLIGINIINILGQTVQYINTGSQTNLSYIINLSSMSRGIYFIKCNFAAGTITRKILLQ